MAVGAGVRLGRPGPPAPAGTAGRAGAGPGSRGGRRGGRGAAGRGDLHHLRRASVVRGRGRPGPRPAADRDPDRDHGDRPLLGAEGRRRGGRPRGRRGGRPRPVGPRGLAGRRPPVRHGAGRLAGRQPRGGHRAAVRRGDLCRARGRRAGGAGRHRRPGPGRPGGRVGLVGADRLGGRLRRPAVGRPAGHPQPGPLAGAVPGRRLPGWPVAGGSRRALDPRRGGGAELVAPVRPGRRRAAAPAGRRGCAPASSRR